MRGFLLAMIAISFAIAVARYTIYGDALFHYPTDGAGNLVDHNQFTFNSGTTVGLDAGHFLTDRLEARVQLASNETDGGADDQKRQAVAEMAESKKCAGEHQTESRLQEAAESYERAIALTGEPGVHLKLGIVLKGRLRQPVSKRVPA